MQLVEGRLQLPALEHLERDPYGDAVTEMPRALEESGSKGSPTGAACGPDREVLLVDDLGHLRRSSPQAL